MIRESTEEQILQTENPEPTSAPQESQVLRQWYESEGYANLSKDVECGDIRVMERSPLLNGSKSGRTESLGSKALLHVGNVLHSAHSQDFERKRKSLSSGHRSRKGSDGNSSETDANHIPVDEDIAKRQRSDNISVAPSCFMR